MTIDELKAVVMLQLGEDVADVSDYSVLLDTYLEAGYRIMADKYLSGDMKGVEPLVTENLLPAWTHSALADYATYRILMNGNAQKQNRASAFYATFRDTTARMKSKKDEEALNADELLTGERVFKFKNLYSN